MTREKSQYSSQKILGECIEVARGRRIADLVLKEVTYLDVFSGTFKQGDVAVHKGVIVGVGETYQGVEEFRDSSVFVVPGFIDSHVHIESSLMTPERFSETVLPCGTTSVIWDPHEIANVLGKQGIHWALEASEGLPLDIYVMIPSCVPSTSPELNLETSGAVLHAADLMEYRSHPRVLGLAEMMNFPGLLNGDDDVHAKLDGFKQMKRDGHCPGLRGKDLNAYGVAGIHSCHESTTLPEAEEKLTKGIHVLIREGSCAKDAHALLPIVNAYTSACVGMCSDDRNPADIAAEGHINFILELGLNKGLAPEALFRAASYAPANMYGLHDRGAVAPGYLADLVLVKKKAANWQEGMSVSAVLKKGKWAHKIAEHRNSSELTAKLKGCSNLKLDPVTAKTFHVAAKSKASAKCQVIGVIPRQILTEALQHALPVKDGAVLADLKQDILKLAVLERHHGSQRCAVGFVQGFGLKEGAIATSINHDSHNVICVGSSDDYMQQAVNRLREIDGGIVVVCQDRVESLTLPIGGLMTDARPEEVASKLLRLKELTLKAGCVLEEPFLQLSFLALPVIPTLKLTDRGLVDGRSFKIVEVVLS